MEEIGAAYAPNENFVGTIGRIICLLVGDGDRAQGKTCCGGADEEPQQLE